MAESEVTVQILGFIEANTLLVTEIDGGAIYIGMPIFGDGIAEGTIVTAFGTGTGGLGSYEVNINQTAAGPGLSSILITGVTGPPYPPAPLPDGIGFFAIGISQIGTVPPLDVWRTIISQYVNSPILTTIIENIFSNLDQTADFEAFFDFIWNVDTAQGHGLDIWGAIVNISRTIQVNEGDWLGFEEAGGDPFGISTFFAGVPITDNFLLSDDAYRLLIFAKAATNITNGSIPAINAILLSLFPGRGNTYVTEGTITADWFGFAESINANGFNQQSFYEGQVLSSMSIQYVFTFALTPVELAIVSQSGALPKPTGVSASVVVI